MSFFVGRDNNGREIVHITDGTHSADYMKSGVKPETTFHNDLEFNTYALYTAYTRVTKTWSDGSKYYCTGCVDYAGDPYRDYYQMAQGTGITKARYASQVYYLDKNKNILPEGNFKWGRRYGDDYYVEQCYDIVDSRSTTHYIPYYSVDGSSCESNRMPIRYVMVFSKNKIIHNDGALIAGSKNGPAQFVVGGFDVGQIKYVSSKVINNHPACTVLNPAAQLIDAAAISGGIEIISNTLGGTQIKKGGYTIVDGSIGLTIVATHNFSATIPSSKTNRFASTVPEVHKITTNHGSVLFTSDPGTEILLYSYKYRVNDRDGFFSHYEIGELYYGVSNGYVYTRGDRPQGRNSHTIAVKVEVSR